MKKKLLLDLADTIESDQVPQEQFNMNMWGKQNGLFCGCAIGWGIKLGLLEEAELKVCQIWKGRDLTGPMKLHHKTDESLELFDIPAQIFDISYIKAVYLFGPDRYSCVDTKKQEVVNRIRKFVKDKEN